VPENPAPKHSVIADLGSSRVKPKYFGAKFGLASNVQILNMSNGFIWYSKIYISGNKDALGFEGNVLFARTDRRRVFVKASHPAGLTRVNWA
jgi:hypothetical protein